MTQFARQTDPIKNYITLLRNNQYDFTIRHGTYTTTIITSHGEKKFITNDYPTKVFIAGNMIKRDVKLSPYSTEILCSKHSKANFSHYQKLQPLKANRVLNIDISKAYATCLRNSGLIQPQTFDYLNTLKKEQRLPCVGFLAKSHCDWVYQKGECTDIITFQSDTAEIFFYLIHQIDQLMRSVEYILGKYFYFYWVDGVFFDYETPKHLVRQVEHLISEMGYHYKYEMVENFSLTKAKNIFTISMIKNDIPKTYTFSDQVEIAKQLLKQINSLSQKKQDEGQ